MSRIVCVSNHKGGVGKTTIVANLGFSLARYFKVLLVDMDPQANLSLGLGLQNHPENISRYFKEVIHFRSPVVEPIVINEYVHMIPGSFDLLKIENQLHETPRAENVLEEILRQVKSSYDLILLDCPPSFNLLTINAITCCNLVIIPAKPEKFSVHGIHRIETYATELGIPFKILFNQVNMRSLLHKKVMATTKTQFLGSLIDHPIRNTVGLAEAFEHAQNIFKYKEESIGAEDFVKVADELLPYF